MEFTKEIRKIRGKEIEREPSSDLEVIDQLNDPNKLSQHILNMEGRKQMLGYRRIRLSQIDSVCPREWILGNVLEKKKYDFAAFPNLVMMNMGSAIHWWIQNNPDGVFGKGNFLGYWKCLACGNRRRFGVKPDNKCEICGAHPRATVYDEYYFRLDKPYLVTGKVDGIIRVKDRFRILDIKTGGKDITFPDAKNIIQVGSYMYFSQYDESDSKLPIEIDRSIGYIVHINKVYNFRNQIKTFPVRPTARLMEPAIEKAEAFTEGCLTGILPEPLPECRGALWRNSRAKNCGTGSECHEHFDNGVEIIDI